MTWTGAYTRHAFSVLVTPPEKEPLTIDEVYLRAALSRLTPTDPRDDMMKDFLAAARSKVEQDTGLALITQTRDLFYDGGPLNGQPLLLVVPQCRPLQSVISVAPIAPTPTPPIVLPPASLPWPETPEGTGVVIRLKAGFGDDGAALRTQAPQLLQAVGLLVAHYATLGRDLASAEALTDVPQGYWELLTAYIPLVAP